MAEPASLETGLYANRVRQDTPDEGTVRGRSWRHESEGDELGSRACFDLARHWKQHQPAAVRDPLPERNHPAEHGAVDRLADWRMNHTMLRHQLQPRSPRELDDVEDLGDADQAASRQVERSVIPEQLDRLPVDIAGRVNDRRTA